MASMLQSPYVQVALGYLGAISLLAVILTIADKRQAIHHGRRIPEATLLLFSVLGGSVAMYVTMRLIHHKTRKPKFMVGIPLILFVQIALAVGGWFLFNDMPNSFSFL